MATQIVQHKSRDFNVTLNFSDTENNLTWSFTAENDGEIYDVELDNVDSYQIAGSPVTLPFSVTAGTSYAVSIVKETTGVAASITFKTRRAISKNVNLNVPDFGAHDGRYIAVISDNKLYKIDSDFINDINSTDKGVYSTSPIIDYVELPEIEEEYVRWEICSFIVLNNIGYYICATTYLQTSNYRLYSCLVDVNTMNVFSLSYVSNEKTTLRAGISVSANSTVGVHIDYINNIALFRCVGNNTDIICYNFNTESITLSGSNSTLTLSITKSAARPHLQMIPYTNEFCLGNILINHLTEQNRNIMRNAMMAVYDIVGNTVHTFNGSITTQMRIYNLEGKVIATVNVSGDPSGNRSMSMSLSSDIGWMMSCSSNNNIILAHPLRPLASGVSKLAEVRDGHTRFNSLYPSKKNHFYIACGFGGDSGKTLYIFKPELGYSDIDYNYIIFNEDIKSCTSNQILI